MSEISTAAERDRIFWEEVADEAEEHIIEDQEDILIEGHQVSIGYHNDSYSTPWQVWKFGKGDIASSNDRDDAIEKAAAYLREHAQAVIEKVSSYWMKDIPFFLRHHKEQMCPICIKTVARQKLWQQLGDIPVNDDGEIEEPFLDFEIGTDREEIWQWFEETFGVTLGDLLGKS